MTMFYKIKQVLAFLHEAKNYWGDPEKAKVWVEEKVAESKKQEDVRWANFLTLEVLANRAAARILASRLG